MKNTKVRVSKTRIEWTEEAYKTESVLVAEDGWNARQDDIDELFAISNKLLDRIKELFCGKEDALKQRDSFIKAHHIAMNGVCNPKRELDGLRDLVDVLEEQKITHFYKSKNTEINIKVLKKED